MVVGDGIPKCLGMALTTVLLGAVVNILLMMAERTVLVHLAKLESVTVALLAIKVHVYAV